MLVTVRRDEGPVTMLLALIVPSSWPGTCPAPFDRAGVVPARPGAMRSLSGGIGARGFRIAAPLLSLTATVLPLMASGRPKRSSPIVRGSTPYGEEPMRHAG